MKMTRVFHSMLTDLRIGLSNQQVGYLLAVPLILAGVLKALEPIIEGAKPTIVAAGEFHRVEVEAMEARMHVLWVKDRQALLRRVEGIDDVVGVWGSEKGDPEVFFEGNEPSSLRSYPGLILNETTARLEGGTVIRWKMTPVAPVGGRTRNKDLAIVLLLTMLVVALFPALTIVEDRQTKSLDSLRVTPLSFAEYALAKALLIVDLTLICAVAVLLILVDGPVAWTGLLAASMAIVPTGFVFAALIGAFAKDQMAAMTLLKIGLPLLLVIPAAGFFVGDESLWMLAPWTPYWAGQALHAALEGHSDRLAEALVWSAVTGIPLVAASLMLLRTQLGWRAS
jgi:hypothetical protein